MEISVNARLAGNVTVVEARGRLTLAAGGTALRDTVHVLVNKGEKRFILDLAGIEFIDSFGIGELVRSYTTVRKRGGDLKLLRVSKTVHDLLEITHLSAVFSFISDKDAQDLENIEW
jgi:anti-sigma B factor antagonist